MNPTLKKITLFLASIILLLIVFMGYTLMKIKSETSAMTTIETSEITNGVYTIKDDFTNMFLVENNGKYIAIDAGKKIQSIIAGLEKLQIDPMDVVAVLLTHTDEDHVAAVGLFKNAEVFISTEEEQMINGTTKRMFIFENKLEYAYKLLDDNQTINIDSMRVKGILTKGHTPGSMCYQINDKYLFTGDCIMLESGKAGPFNNFFNMDSETALQSHSKLKNLKGVEYIFTAHYGYTSNYSAAF